MTPCSSCSAHEIAHCRSEYALHRALLQAYDMNLDVSRAQRRRHLEPDEACPDHHRAFRAVGRCNDRAAIVQRAQHMDMGLARAGNRQPHRLRAGRQQQTVVGNGLAAGEQHLSCLGFDRGHFRLQPQVDRGIGVKTIGPQRQPVLRGAAGEIIL
jgi:hypothetical protein